ncbi:hypothetical protein C8F01DRAFT_1087156 [Mycena amicta]|nr:hypothetical protein C8F01DRAFT_1087156 [Mycena amicta]
MGKLREHHPLVWHPYSSLDALHTVFFPTLSARDHTSLAAMVTGMSDMYSISVYFGTQAVQDELMLENAKPALWEMKVNIVDGKPNSPLGSLPAQAIWRDVNLSQTALPKHPPSSTNLRLHCQTDTPHPARVPRKCRIQFGFRSRGGCQRRSRQLFSTFVLVVGIMNSSLPIPTPISELVVIRANSVERRKIQSQSRNPLSKTAIQ